MFSGGGHLKKDILAETNGAWRNNAKIQVFKLDFNGDKRYLDRGLQEESFQNVFLCYKLSTP